MDGLVFFGGSFFLGLINKLSGKKTFVVLRTSKSVFDNLILNVVGIGIGIVSVSINYYGYIILLTI
jgi:hypothetical protein